MGEIRDVVDTLLGLRVDDFTLFGYE